MWSIFCCSSAMNDLYAAAVQAEAGGRINDCFVDCLLGSGRNIALSDGLRKDGAFHAGFINYELSKLKLLLGPDESFKYSMRP